MRIVALSLFSISLLTGCASSALTRRVAALEAKVEENHVSMHAEDDKIVKAVRTLSYAQSKTGRDLDDLIDSQLPRRIFAIENFQNAHDKRWPPKVEKKK